MKAKPLRLSCGGYDPCEPSAASHVQLDLPGPFPNRFIPVILKGSRRDHQGAVWSWNGDTEKPTLRPSIASKAPREITDDEADRIMKGEKLNIEDTKCHTWITDGNVIFLNDCTHELAGQTLPMNEVD